jgi:hypothetical protein
VHVHESIPLPDGVASASSPFDEQLGCVHRDHRRRHQGPADGDPTLQQPMGIVHGGVYCAVIESVASTSAYVWLSEHGGGNVVGVNNTDFLRAISSGTVYAVSNRSIAAAVSSSGSSRSPTSRIAWSPAARSGCRTWRPEPRSADPAPPC